MEKYRKFVWILCFACIFINGMMLGMPEVSQAQKMNAGIFGLMQCLYCYFMFDKVWGTDKEEEE
jgi:hypothetical protein